MKKNILYLTVFILTLSFGACSLDEDPRYDFNSKLVFDTKATADAVLMEAYGGIAYIYGELIFFPTVANGTMVTRIKAEEHTRAANYDIDPLGKKLTDSYQTLYKVIDLSNRIMESLEDSSLPDDYKENSMGQVYFLRGYSYYLLGTLWGRASIHTKPIGDESTFHKPLSSRVDVYAQAERDFKVALEKLPVEEQLGKGMANKNVANAFLAKLYFMLASQKQAGLETSNYATAKELWDKVVEYGEKVKGKENLEANYADLFKTGVSNSKEIIFQLNYTSATPGARKNWNTHFAPYWYSVNSASQQSYRTIVMDRAFYDYQVGTHPNDKRIETTFLTDFEKNGGGYKYSSDRRAVSYPFILDQKFKYVRKEDGTLDKIATEERLINGRDFMEPGSDPRNPKYDFTNLKKGSDKEKVYKVWTDVGYGVAFKLFPYNGKASDVNSKSNYDSNNVILFRNADLLLILADAYNEIGNGAKADEYINLVLNRAGLSDVSGMSEEDRRDFIFFERMFELAGEPIVFEDIRRRGTEYLKKVIEIHNNSHFINFRMKIEKEAEEDPNKKIVDEFRAIIINDKNLDENFLKKNLLLPIPQEEIIQNENISQADQNFGYN